MWLTPQFSSLHKCCIRQLLTKPDFLFRKGQSRLCVATVMKHVQVLIAIILVVGCFRLICLLHLHEQMLKSIGQLVGMINCACKTTFDYLIYLVSYYVYNILIIKCLYWLHLVLNPSHTWLITQVYARQSDSNSFIKRRMRG